MALFLRPGRLREGYWLQLIGAIKRCKTPPPADLLLPDCQRNRCVPAIADNIELDRAADRCGGNEARQVAVLVDVLTLEFDDHVVRLKASLLSRPGVVDTEDQRAARRINAEAIGDIRGHLTEVRPERCN